MKLIEQMLGIIIVLLVVYGFLWLITASVGDGVQNECGEGYHWEEDFRGTVSGCVPN